MNVKCPYCGCNYNIETESLPKPVGDSKLGYGWWLRCCKCQKKWWLKHLSVQIHANSPIKADISEKINRLSRLKKQKDAKKTLKNIWSFIKYLLLILLIGAGVFGFYNKKIFAEYIKQKVERLSSNIAFKLRMLDVRYFLETNNQSDVILTVNGKIINDDKSVIRLNGIKVSVYDENNNEIEKWTDSIGTEYIMPGETLDFNTKHIVNKPDSNIKVDVSII